MKNESKIQHQPEMLNQKCFPILPVALNYLKVYTTGFLPHDLFNLKPKMNGNNENIILRR